MRKKVNINLLTKILGSKKFKAHFHSKLLKVYYLIELKGLLLKTLKIAYLYQGKDSKGTFLQSAYTLSWSKAYLILEMINTFHI